MGFKDKFETGVFTVLAELDPPKGINTEGIIANAVRASELYDAFVLSEMNGGVMRMSPLGVALLLAKHGIGQAVEFAPCHQNRLSLQGSLLAAHAIGADAVVISPGTPPSYGDNIEGKMVDDLTYSGLIKIACDLRSGQDLGGNALDGSPDYLVGAVLPDLSENAIREAAESGADFVVSPPVFDEESVRGVLADCKTHNVALIAGVVLLKSVGMARYMQQHLPGVSISDSVIDRLRKGRDAADECVSYAAELVKMVRDAGASGALVCTHGWEDRLTDLMSRAAL